MHIGLNIRKIRTQQNRTQQEIADSSGFTKSLISKIENGVVVPPVATLSRIAQALGVAVSVLMEEGDGSGCGYTQADQAENGCHAKTEKGYEFYPYSAEMTNKKMQPCLVVAQKGQVIPHSLSHSGEEFIYMLEGEMKLRIGDAEYRMRPGDTMYFDALQGHGIMPVTDHIKYMNIFVG
jgi:transcriptional regulator with XRE-family HTH domain